MVNNKDNLMDKETELLLSEHEVNINGRKVIVHKLSLLDTIRLATHLSEVAGSVIRQSELSSRALSKIVYKADNADEGTINNIRLLGVVELLGIVGDDGAELLKDIIVKATNLNEEEAEQLDAVDGIDLVADIYEVNKGFFMKFTSKLKEKLPKNLVSSEASTPTKSKRTDKK